MYSRDPRDIAKKAELYLKQTGIADISYWGPEAEFYIFDSIRYDQNQFEGYYHVDAVAGAWNSGGEEDGKNLGYKPRYKEGYFALPPVDKYQDLRTDMVLNLEKVGLTIEVHHHEVGTAGQAEIDMRYDTLLTTADNVMKYKYVVKNTAYHAGKTVTFMPKPLFMDNGSGMHTHQSLWTGRREPVLGRGRLRRHQRHGALVHRRPAGARAVAARVHEPDDELVPPAGAGIRGADQPRVQPAEPQRVRPHPAVLEEPTAEAPGVPHAGPVVQPVPRVQRDADGGHRRHQEQDRAAGAHGQGPVRPAARGEGDGQAGARVAREVLDNLETDHQWLLEGGVFTQDVIDTWIEYKRVNEVDAVRLRPHPHEFAHVLRHLIDRAMLRGAGVPRRRPSRVT